MYQKVTAAQRAARAEREAMEARAAAERLAADLDYMAMMAEIELEMEEEHDES